MAEQSGRDIFSNAPELRQPYDKARDYQQQRPDQRKDVEQAQDRPAPRPRPSGPMREMSNQVDRQVQEQNKARKALAHIRQERDQRLQQTRSKDQSHDLTKEFENARERGR